jgi:hypothetical protein
MKLLLSTIALSLLAATPALAAKKAKLPKGEYPWFIQLGVGAVVSSNAEDQALDDLAQLGHDITDYNYESGSNSFQLELGYRFNQNWAVTAGYMSFGATSFETTASTAYDVELIDEIARAAPKYGNGNTYSLVYSHELSPSFVANVDAGLLYLETKSRVQSGFTSYELTDHALQYFVGAGVDYKYEKMRVGVYLRHYDIDQTGSQWLGVRLGYHF